MWTWIKSFFGFSTANPPMITVTGKMSWFGGPRDTGMASDEGLALLNPLDVDNPRYAGLWLPQQR